MPLDNEIIVVNKGEEIKLPLSNQIRTLFAENHY